MAISPTLVALILNPDTPPEVLRDAIMEEPDNGGERITKLWVVYGKTGRDSRDVIDYPQEIIAEIDRRAGDLGVWNVACYVLEEHAVQHWKELTDWCDENRIHHPLALYYGDDMRIPDERRDEYDDEYDALQEKFGGSFTIPLDPHHYGYDPDSGIRYYVDTIPLRLLD